MCSKLPVVPPFSLIVHHVRSACRMGASASLAMAIFAISIIISPSIVSPHSSVGGDGMHAMIGVSRGSACRR